jgi:hypothetical protein
VRNETQSFEKKKEKKKKKKEKKIRSGLQEAAGCQNRLPGCLASFQVSVNALKEC